MPALVPQGDTEDGGCQVKLKNALDVTKLLNQEGQDFIPEIDEHLTGDLLGGSGGDKKDNFFQVRPLTQYFHSKNFQQPALFLQNNFYVISRSLFQREILFVLLAGFNALITSRPPLKTLKNIFSQKLQGFGDRATQGIPKENQGRESCVPNSNPPLD